MKNILIVIGTRPNFIKVTQFKELAKQHPNLNIKLVHTGQHYDSKMADVFFEQFNLIPDYFLNISPASANTQMADIMLKLEQLILNEFKPDLMIVVGDVNSTLAGALTANKLGIKLAHLESGLRSNDRTMPEEINRILTDELSDYYFVTEQSGIDHLKQQQVADDKLIFVGNTMIDTLVAFSNHIEQSDILEKYNLREQAYVLMTIHRPATVDTKDGLVNLISLIKEVSKSYNIVFPIHPRTINNLKRFELYQEIEEIKQLIVSEPLDYFAFQKLIKYSKFILTDSGGIQEESTFLQVPCLTLRPNTERPITCTLGSNTLIPFDLNEIKQYINAIENNSYKKGSIPPLWDGKSTERILNFISEKF